MILSHLQFQIIPFENAPENTREILKNPGKNIDIIAGIFDEGIILCTPATAFFPEGKTEGVTSHDIQPLVVSEIADICRQVAQERGYTLLDVHAFTAGHPEWFEQDGVHPSKAGAAAIARKVANVLATQH